MNHIISILDPKVSWCGETILVTIDSFKTVDQAAVNGLFPDTKRPCPQCIQGAINALLKNLEVNND